MYSLSTLNFSISIDMISSITQILSFFPFSFFLVLASPRFLISQHMFFCCCRLSSLFQREKSSEEKMGYHHHTCCNRQRVKRGLWSPEEDEKLRNYITNFGHGSWSSVPRLAGLQRCGKSCRLRWINYLRPDLKRGSFSRQEATIIVELHNVLGNKWAQIAKHLPGRTDNEVKNFWNSSVKKKFVESNQFDRTLPDQRMNLGADSRASSSGGPFLMNPTTNFLPNPIQSFDGLVNHHANYSPFSLPTNPLPPQNYPYHHFPIMGRHSFVVGSGAPNPVFAGSNNVAQTQTYDNNNNYYPNSSSGFEPTTGNAAQLTFSAQPPVFEEIAGIDASFMAAPPSPMRYLETLIAEIESPSATGSSGSSSAASPAMPCSRSSPFLDDRGFVSFWGGHQP